MIPDSLESRMARVEQRVNDLADDMKTVVPLGSQLAVINERQEVTNQKVDKIQETLQDRDNAQAAERRGIRLALLGVFGASFASLIGVIGGIVMVVIR